MEWRVSYLAADPRICILYCIVVTFLLAKTKGYLEASIFVDTYSEFVDISREFVGI
jgi:hypothetical protein